MDVQCERCNTEYEFDDALVSGRGTTVKCTNCGHKFKIRRRDGDFSEDFWNVQTGDGRTLVFTSLRELQRAIQTNLVDRNDRLSRGGLPQKAIGQIPELAPFFEQREKREQERKRTPAPPGPSHSPAATTLHDGSGSGMIANTRSSRPPPPPGVSPASLGPPRQRLSTKPDFPPQQLPDPTPAHERPSYVSAVKTLVGTGDTEADEAAERALHAEVTAAAAAAAANAIPAAPAMRARLASVKPSEPRDEFPEEEPDTTRYDRAEPLPERPRSAPPVPAPPRPLGAPRARAASAPPHYEVSSPLPPPVQPAMRHESRGYEPDEYEAGIRSSLPDAPHSVGRRRSVGGYVVAFFVIGGVAVVGAMWARDHLGPAGAKPPASATADPRVATLLSTGEKALADGDLENAKESFDKASALAEKDPRVLLDVARLTASRADVPWLKTRLLAGDNADEQRLAKQNLTDLSAAARRAADDALAVAPEDPAALRAKIDALRIAGDREAARALVAKVAASSTQPETAYVLAALDLAENEPLWSTVIQRLRVAASAESGPGRARAALAYALARSGDVAGAKAEVERLSSMSRPHALLPLLRTFADHAKPSQKIETVDAHALDGGPVDPKHPGDKHVGGGNVGGSSDPRVLVSQAEKARAKGEYDKALGLYNSALEHSPNDTEALSGLAAIAYARRDLNGARSSYKRVLSINPSYIPALVGVGDVDWDSGDKASAMKAYKEIVDRFPEGTYPPRVKQRLDSAVAPVPATAPSPSPSPSPSTAPSPSPSDTAAASSGGPG